MLTSTMTNNSSSVIHARVEGGAEKWATLFSLTASDFGDLRMGRTECMVMKIGVNEQVRC